MMRRHSLLALLAATLLLSGPGACTKGSFSGRVLVLGLDGVDPRAVDLLMSEGKLPNFARLRQQGAYGRLASDPPLLSPVLWTTVATGKTPDQHGIGDFTVVEEATGKTVPVTSQTRRVKAIWNILSDAGKKVGVVGWWATWPAEKIRGSIVSDRIGYHFLSRPSDDTGERLTFPPRLVETLSPLIRGPDDVTPEEATRFVQVSPDALARSFDFQDDLSHFKWALATADSNQEIGLHLWRQESPDLLMTYIEGTDSVSHLFGHLFRAEELSGELADQQEQFGRTVEEMYLYTDGIVGDYIDAVDDDTTLVVLSDHGFELGKSHDDPSKTRDVRRVSEDFHRPRGILYLYGRRVRRGSLIDQPKLVDLTPTLLALVGLPAAQDMPGRVLSEVLDFDPAPRVASYQTSTEEAVRISRDADTDQAVKKRLESLGYLGKQSKTGARPSLEAEKTIAATVFQSGRHQEAADRYAELIREHPDDASLRASFGGALGALERYDEALEELETAIGLDPLNAEAYFNRGAIFERKSRPDLAIEQYRIAVKVDSGYQPAREALQHLTGSADVNPPQTEQQQRARELAEEASQAARRADYALAMKLLDDAERLAPDYVLVYQYRSNVAYLMGNRDRAIRALERALSLEPENALFQANLERLKREPDPEKN